MVRPTAAQYYAVCKLDAALGRMSCALHQHPSLCKLGVCEYSFLSGPRQHDDTHHSGRVQRARLQLQGCKHVHFIPIVLPVCVPLPGLKHYLEPMPAACPCTCCEVCKAHGLGRCLPPMPLLGVFPATCEGNFWQVEDPCVALARSLPPDNQCRRPHGVRVSDWWQPLCLCRARLCIQASVSTTKQPEGHTEKACCALFTRSGANTSTRPPNSSVHWISLICLVLSNLAWLANTHASYLAMGHEICFSSLATMTAESAGPRALVTAPVASLMDDTRSWVNKYAVALGSPPP